MELVRYEGQATNSSFDEYDAFDEIMEIKRRELDLKKKAIEAKRLKTKLEADSKRQEEEMKRKAQKEKTKQKEMEAKIRLKQLEKEMKEKELQERIKQKQLDEDTKQRKMEAETKQMQIKEEIKQKQIEEETKRMLKDEETKQKELEEQTKRKRLEEETKQKELKMSKQIRLENKQKITETMSEVNKIIKDFEKNATKLDRTIEEFQKNLKVKLHELEKARSQLHTYVAEDNQKGLMRGKTSQMDGGTKQKIESKQNQVGEENPGTEESERYDAKKCDEEIKRYIEYIENLIELLDDAMKHSKYNTSTKQLLNCSIL